jgi:hypothetical protein
MLHRQLLILQSFTGMLFGVPIAPNALNATLSRQDPVNVAHRLVSEYTARIGGFKVHRKTLESL